MTPDPGGPTLLWVGTGSYDGAGAGRIVPHALDDLSAADAADAGSLPSWMVLAPDGAHLYAVDENNSRVLAFAVAPDTGALSPKGAVASGGAGPVHLAIDRTGRWLLVAHYTSGDVAVLPIQGDGSLGDTPSDVEATGAKSHQVVIDPTNRYVFVPCVGANQVTQLVFDAERGTLAPNTPASVRSADGAGPRHLALHPDGRHAYVVDETGSTVTAYTYDASHGTLTRGDSLTTLPAGFTDENYGGEIAISADGRFVYATNRGHDSIAVLAVAPGTGALSAVDRTPTGGAFPRSFAIAPGGDRLIVANQNSSALVSFAIDRTTGKLSAPSAPVATGAAAFFVGAFTIPAR